MRRTLRPIGLLAALASLLAAAACGGSDADSAANPGGTPSAGASYPVTVGTVTVAQRPTKIISLSPTTTEMLFAIGAGQQVAAVDDQSNFPAEAPKSDLSGFKPNAEAIAAKNPDLVVLSNDLNGIVAALNKLKIPVYLAPAASTLDDSYREITELGTLTGRATEAADLVQRMKDEIAKLVKDLPARPKKLTYYYELDPSHYTVTEKTFIGSLFALAGMENIARTSAAGDYPQLSAEAVVKANPDTVFLADTKCCGQSAATVKTRPGWAGVTAVRANQVYPLDDDIASRWGPRVVDLIRSIVDAISKIPA